MKRQLYFRIFACLLCMAFLAGCRADKKFSADSAPSAGFTSLKDVLRCAVMVLNDSDMPVACGFFVETLQHESQTNIFFVTAAHVYHGLCAGGISADLKVRQRIQQLNYDFTVPVSNASGLLTGEYQRESIRADLMVVRVENFFELRKQAPELLPYKLSLSAIDSDDRSLSASDPLVAVGLIAPLNTGDDSAKGELLLRHTRVATTPSALIKVRDFTSELIVADHYAWRGCSGAPAFRANVAAEGYRLVGLTTGEVTRDYKANGRDVQEKLPLAYITPVKYICFAITEMLSTGAVNLENVFQLE